MRDHLLLALRRLEDLHRAARADHRTDRGEGIGPLTGQEVRWGVVGPGNIAASVLPDFAHVPGASVAAVASRSLERATDFADRFGIARAYGSYAEMMADDEVDVLYIATPHPQHYEIALAGIEAGKALLVEKSFTATVAGAEEIITAARDHKVFVMEAMWTRFQPAIVTARRLVDEGTIGEVRQVQADLGVDRPYDPKHRLFDPAQGGGAMLDLGVYPVSFAHYFLGEPATLDVVGSLAPTGVDYEAGMLLGYSDGRSASILISLRNALPGAARIFGTEGWIEVPPRFHHPRQLVLHRTGRDPEVIEQPPLGKGYSHELIEVTQCVQGGRSESTVMPLDDTLAVQRSLNDACEQLGVFHAEANGVI